MITFTDLGTIEQGTHAGFLITAARAAAGSVPALDLTTAAEIEFCAVDRLTRSPVLTKTLADGITDVTANTATVLIVPADTSALPAPTGDTLIVLDWAVKVTEAGGRVTVPLRGVLGVAVSIC